MNKGGLRVLYTTCLVLLILVSFVLTGPGCRQKASIRGVSDTEIKIGTSFPMSGPLALDGQDSWRAATLAADQINAAGGINGRKLTLVNEDNAFDAVKTMAAAKKLVLEDGAFAVVMESMAYKSTQSFFNDQDVVYIETVMPWDDLCHDPHVPLTFQMQTNQYGGMTAVVDEMMTRFQPSKIAVLGDTTAYGQTYVDKLKNWLDATYRGQVEIVDSEIADVTSADFSPELLRIKASNPDVLLVFMPGVGCGIAIKQAREMGINTQLMSDLALNVVGMATIAGTAVSGAYFVCNAADSMDFPTKPKFKDFLNAYFQKYPDASHDLGTVTVNTYAAIQIVAEGLRQCGADVTIAKFAGALDTLGDFDPVTILPTGWTSTDHRGSHSYNVFTYDALGKRVLVEGPKPISKMGPHDPE